MALVWAHDVGTAITIVIGGLALLLLLDEYTALRRHADMERFALRGMAVVILAAGVFALMIQIVPWAFR